MRFAQSSGAGGIAAYREEAPLRRMPALRGPNAGTAWAQCRHCVGPMPGLLRREEARPPRIGPAPGQSRGGAGSRKHQSEGSCANHASFHQNQ